MTRLLGTIGVLAAAAALAAPLARADDDVRRELDALKERIREQDRRIRELEGGAPTKDEIAAAVDRYLGNAPNVIAVGGADDGKAGFPMGKKPFIKQGPNKLEIGLRNQVRYEAFFYSDDAVGTLKSPADTVSDAAPRDRSGFEIERLLLTLEGTAFCDAIGYMLQLNFDSDSGSGLEKRFAYVDWKYRGEHHVRAGGDKVAFGYEEQNSSGALAFVDRGLLTKGFGLDFDTGIALWGHFGSCDCPKRFLYKVQALNGEGRIDRGSVFGTDAFDTYSDELLYAGTLEWVITCDEFKWDEVDHRPCEKRCDLAAAVGASAYYENDDDERHDQVGLRLGSSGRLERTGFAAWLRAHWNGWSVLLEGAWRNVDYTAGNPAETQTDYGFQAVVHHRFADSNWGVGAKASVIFLDDDYPTRTVGLTVVGLENTIWEAGLVVNYFFWDHAHKISVDLSWVSDNSAVTSTSAGYLVDPAKGVVIEDGILLRVQWQFSI